MYVLLFLAATSGSPAQLGTYKTEAVCQKAIRTIYETRMTPRGVELPPEAKKAIQDSIEIELKYQTEYKCVPMAIDYN